jgi:hypothetical protein
MLFVRSFFLKIYIFSLKNFLGFFSIKKLQNSSSRSSYEAKILKDVILKKTNLFKINVKRLNINKNKFIFKDAILLKNIIKEKNIYNILDVGGGGGTLYYIFKKFFPNKKFNWFILETKSLTRSFSLKNADKNLFFFSGNKNVKDIQFDLVIMSSVLVYLSKPYDYLKNLLSLKAKYIYISRTYLNDIVEKDTIPTIIMQKTLLSENGPGPLSSRFKDQLICYPFRLLNKLILEKIMKKKYRLLFSKKDKNNFVKINFKKYFDFTCLWKLN